MTSDPDIPQRRGPTQVPPQLQALLDASKSQSPEVQRRVRELLLLDYKMRRAAREVAAMSTDLADALRAMGQRDEAGDDVGMLKLHDVVQRHTRERPERPR